MNDKPTVAVLMGKFNPPTDNKFDVLNVAQDECPSVGASFLVPYSGPTDRMPDISYQDRLFMCSLAIQHRKKAATSHPVGILPIENKFGVQGRVETFRAVCAQFDTPPLVVMGTDRIPVLLKQGQFAEINALAPILFVRRDDHFVVGDALSEFAAGRVESGAELQPGKFMVSQRCVDGASSSKFRTEIWKGRVPGDFVPRAVQQYTKTNAWRLYPINNRGAR